MPFPNPPTAPVRHGALEGAKWVALVTMTIDHYGKIVDPSVMLVTHCSRRLSFPLFGSSWRRCWSSA
jgi:hypothetical protein